MKDERSEAPDSEGPARADAKEVQQLIDSAVRGDPAAAEALLPLVYDELRRLAARRLAREEPGTSLEPTALVHEAYLRLVGPAPHQPWQGRAHFFAAAAEAMRRILIERARHHGRVRHGGGRVRIPLGVIDLAAVVPDEDLLVLDEALTRLAVEDPSKAELVRLRFFAGLTLEESAALQGISRATAARHWAYARAWLYDAICGDAETE
jgi:RNA polymerase sigma factor (TIGR02999 family)